VRIETTIQEAVEDFLRRQPRGASLAQIYAAVEQRVDGIKRPSIRRVLHDGTQPRGERYVRVSRGKYALRSNRGNATL